MSAPQDTITLDPIAMNVVNRVAAGSHLSGVLEFDGGLLVQGEVSGDIRVNGRLIVWGGGIVRGRLQVMGDLYLFGRLGAAGANELDTIVKCVGMAYIANTGVATATLYAKRLKLYDGADLQGPFRTINLADLPVLHEPHVSGARAQ